MKSSTSSAEGIFWLERMKISQEFNRRALAKVALPGTDLIYQSDILLKELLSQVFSKRFFCLPLHPCHRWQPDNRPEDCRKSRDKKDENIRHSFHRWRPDLPRWSTRGRRQIWRHRLFVDFFEYFAFRFCQWQYNFLVQFLYDPRLVLLLERKMVIKMGSPVYFIRKYIESSTLNFMAGQMLLILRYDSNKLYIKLQLSSLFSLQNVARGATSWNLTQNMRFAQCWGLRKG